MPNIAFSSTPPLSLLPPVWVLPEGSLGMEQHASFPETDFQLPILYLIFLLRQNQQNPSWCQHFSTMSMLFWAKEDNQDGEQVGRSDTVPHPSSVFRFLPKFLSSSLLSHDTPINSQETVDWLHCRSSVLDLKAEHSNWYLYALADTTSQ